MTVWVYETFLGCRRPKVVEYEGIEVRESSVTVRIRGSTKVIRRAAGRKFFTSYEEMMRTYRDWVISTYGTWKRNLAELGIELEQTDLGIEIQKIPAKAKAYPSKIKLKDDEEAS